MTHLSNVKFANNILETIGDTPLVKLNRVTKGIKATVLAKVEFMNPGGSVKDRIGIKIIEAALKEGRIKPGGTIVECTSGNTGVGLAMVAGVMGFKAVFTMPDKMSKEKIRLLKSFGAEVITCPTHVAPDSPESYYKVAERFVEETPNSVWVNQYDNQMNPEAHYLTTGPEIWRDTGGQLDYFVCGIGTCGTISGTGKYLKEQNASVKIIGADPEGSILREYFYTKKMGEARPYLVEGIGEDIIPTTFHPQYIDEIMTAGDKESFEMARRLSREEGLLVGGSGGSAVHVALELARELPEDKLVVVLIPDTGERYLSKVHSDEWMRENRMAPTSRTGKLTVAGLLTRKSSEIPPIAYVTTEDDLHTALSRMKNFGITQMPVKRGDEWVGRVVESDLLDRLLRRAATGEQPVEGVMADPFPTVSGDADIADALKLFANGSEAVLVTDDGDVKGLLTKSDLVDYMLSELK